MNTRTRARTIDMPLHLEVELVEQGRSRYGAAHVDAGSFKGLAVFADLSRRTYSLCENWSEAETWLRQRSARTETIAEINRRVKS